MAPRYAPSLHPTKRKLGRQPLRHSLLAFALAATLFYPAHAAEPIYEFPLADLPFNTAHGGRFPSMAQSLALSQDYYQFAHIKIADALANRNPAWFAFSIVGFDVLSTWIPLGDSWVHDEWHRAVLSSRGINSYDEVNTFPLFSDAISVNHVTDEDLTLKRDHPAELVRLHAAGLEAQNEMNVRQRRLHATRCISKGRRVAAASRAIFLRQQNKLRRRHSHSCHRPTSTTLESVRRA